MENLKMKDGAKILYNLYKDCFNRFANRAVYVSLELTEEQEEKFRQYFFLTHEEIWAYANNIIEIPEEKMFSKRKRDFPKKHFLNAVITPIIKIFTQNDYQKKYDVVNAFVLYYHLFSDDFDETMHWLCEGGSITEEEANQVADNVKRFLEK